MLKEISMTQPVVGANQDGTSARLKSICAEFESIFMTYMLKTMRSALVEDGIMGNSHETKIMNSMFDENLALEVAHGGGIGLGDVLFERLKGASGWREILVANVLRSLMGIDKKPVQGIRCTVYGLLNYYLRPYTLDLRPFIYVYLLFIFWPSGKIYALNPGPV